MKNVLRKRRSLVRTSDKLFRQIAEEVDRVYPKKLFWKDFMYALAVAQPSDMESFKLTPPPEGSMKKMSVVDTQLFVDEIDGRVVSTRILFPVDGPAIEKNKVLEFYLSRFKLNFPVVDGGVVVKVTLPFAPVEIKIECDGTNGSGHKAFICPDELVEVS